MLVAKGGVASSVVRVAAKEVAVLLPLWCRRRDWGGAEFPLFQAAPECLLRGEFAGVGWVRGVAGGGRWGRGLGRVCHRVCDRGRLWLNWGLVRVGGSRRRVGGWASRVHSGGRLGVTKRWVWGGTVLRHQVRGVHWGGGGGG